MDRSSIYIATVDPQGHRLAREYGLGIEISEFCTAYNMDEEYGVYGPLVEEKAACAQRLVVHAPFNELFPCAIDPKARALARDRYCQAMTLAEQLGAKKLVIHGGYHPWIYYPVWYVEQSILFWREFVPRIPQGMTVCLENVLEPDPEYLLDIVTGVDSPKLRLCLDIGHVNAYSKLPAAEWIRRWGGWISHFHIHNNDGDFDTHQPLDQGSIPMEEVLRLAQEFCPGASFTLELPEAAGSVAWLVERGLLPREDDYAQQ